MEISLIFCLCFYLICRRGKNHFDVPFRRIRPYFFLSKDGKDAVREKKWTERCFFPASVGIFPFDKYYD